MEFFRLAVLAVVVSFLVSQKAFQNEIDAVDARWAAVNAAEAQPSAQQNPEKPKTSAQGPNRYAEHTRRLNFASGGLFVSGIIFFVLFGAFNWPVKEATSKTAGTPIKIEITGEVMHPER